MGKAEMAEIAGIFKLVLSNTRPTLTKKGAPSRINYTLDPAIAAEAQARANALLDRFPVYPELDLALLLSVTGVED
jgi:glycine hydroxymethyltransferase